MSFTAKKEEAGGSDNEAAEVPSEAPMYAEKGKVKFAEGAQIQKSPYTKSFERRVCKFKIVAPKDRLLKLDQGTLSLEWMPSAQESKKSFILVFRTMRPLYVGQLSA